MAWRLLSISGLLLVLSACSPISTENRPSGGFVGFGTNNWYGGTPAYFNTSLVIDD